MEDPTAVRNPWQPTEGQPPLGQPTDGRPPHDPAPGAANRFGPRQAVVLVLGFFLVQTLVGTGAVFLRGFVLALAQRLRVPLHGGGHVVLLPGAPGATFLAGSVIAGYVLAALWCRRYVLRRAGERLRRGTPDGIGWCPAPAGAYRMAAVLAAGTVAAAALILQLAPMPQIHLQNSPFEALLEPGWMLGPSLLLMFVIAPLAEEFIFRGAAFAALAGRAGTPGAAAIVTLLFVAVHAPEKIHYPPGFVDVALMALAAVWLRLRYRSIKPAVLLHVLYNLGVSGAAVLLH
jgi:membrane protease YdiL (CAAX protease family)